MRKLISGIMLGVVLLTSGCGGARIAAVDDWMQEERGKARPAVKPLVPPAPYVAVEYSNPLGLEPFNMARLLQAINAANANNPTSALYREVIERHRKQPLEAYPLDSLSYVGMLNKNGLTVALIKVSDLLYQVRVGDFMGQNYGRITAITEGQLTLREVIQDNVGEWVERDTTLNLQEGS